MRVGMCTSDTTHTMIGLESDDITNVLAIASIGNLASIRQDCLMVTVVARVVAVLLGADVDVVLVVVDIEHWSPHAVGSREVHNDREFDEIQNTVWVG